MRRGLVRSGLSGAIGLDDSESEEEFVAVGRGEMPEEKSEWAGGGLWVGEEGVGGSDAEGKKKVKSRRR